MSEIETSFFDTSLDDKVEEINEFAANEQVTVETVSAPMNLVPPDPNATGPWIEYTGIATVRILCDVDWRTLGINSDLYCEWNYLNKMRLPKSMFSDEQLNYLLNQDGRFQLVDDEIQSETTE